MSGGSGSRDVDGRSIKVSNEAKVLFPGEGITKGELIDHYERCAPAILRAVGGRPLTLIRYPDGIEGEHWFQKHAPPHLPAWVPRATIPSGARGGTVEHVVAEGAATIVYLANLAAIELHTGPAPAATPDVPDELVLDLDPPPGADAKVVRRAVRRTRDLLHELDLPSRLKSSGSSGFHVHLALEGGATQDLVREVARGLATVLARRHPDELTVEHRVARRGERVFVDWLRNSPRQSFVAAYSVRARPGAPVATPMDWDELSGTDPQRWTLRSLPRRLTQRGDAWQEPPQRADPHRFAPAVSEVLAESAAPRGS